MRVLLVEPEYRRASKSFIKKVSAPDAKKRDDETLWYPPLGLLKISTFHKKRGDEVRFVIGCDEKVFGDLFDPQGLWDRVYVSSLFTFGWKDVIKTINFYKQAVGGSSHKIFVGGVMASLMPKLIFEETTITPIIGLLDSPKKIHLEGEENIDLLPPDYSILDPKVYAINDTYYSYTTKGCTNKCSWCGVPTIEDKFDDYIDIKQTIKKLRNEYGDKSKLKLMDNNVLASPRLEDIVNDLLALGYGKGEYTKTYPKKMRVIDFNQGVDASHLNERNIGLISRLNIRPLRIAFDKISEKDEYVNALKLAKEYGFKEFSNYMLFNHKDTPKDLYDRLIINIDLNDEWLVDGQSEAVIYSYPMRFAPINNLEVDGGGNISRDLHDARREILFNDMFSIPWNRRFLRNVEIIKAAANGAISPTPSLARRAIGKDFRHFIANLYMPEELLRNRNKYEKKIYSNDIGRDPGTGDVESFYEFIFNLIERFDDRFYEFHKIVSLNSVPAIKKYIESSKDKELLEWMKFYIIK